MLVDVSPPELAYAAERTFALCSCLEVAALVRRGKPVPCPHARIVHGMSRRLAESLKPLRTIHPVSQDEGSRAASGQSYAKSDLFGVQVNCGCPLSRS